MLLLISVVFSVQNYGVVKIQFLFWFFHTSRAIMFFITLALEIVIGWITAGLFRSK